MAPIKKKSLAEQLAELSMPVPRDVDPEALEPYQSDSDHGSDNDAPLHDEELATEHYLPVGASQMRRAKWAMEDDTKYQGKRTSRKDLGRDEGDAEDPEEEEEEEDRSDFGSENSAESSEEGDDAASDASKDTDSASSGSVSEEEQEQGVTDLQAELENLAQQNRQLIKSVAASANADVEKGQQTRHQLSMYEGLLDVRIRSQRCLNLSNALPSPTVFPLFVNLAKDEADREKRQAALQEVKHSLHRLMSTMFDLKRELVSSSREMYEASLPNSAQVDLDALLRTNFPPASANLETLWERQCSWDTQMMNSFRDVVTDKWNTKVQIASAGSLLKNKTLKAMTQGVPQQIQQLMAADWERLQRRTRLVRGNHKQLGLPLLSLKRKREEEVAVVEEQGKPATTVMEEERYDEEIFDDNDYYSTVLRELIDSKISETDDPLLLSMHWAKMKELQKKNRKQKTNVDRKASKGRRLRYDVHEKLSNFMVPIEQATWHEDMTQELFRTLSLANKRQ